MGHLESIVNYNNILKYKTNLCLVHKSIECNPKDDTHLFKVDACQSLDKFLMPQ